MATKNASQFNEITRRHIQATQQAFTRAIKSAALDIWVELILQSVVDRGWFRVNWIVYITKNGVDVDVDADAARPPGKKTFGSPTSPIVRGEYTIGDVIQIINAVPYATDLEAGKSERMPTGIIKPNIDNFNRILDGWLKKAVV